MRGNSETEVRYNSDNSNDVRKTPIAIDGGNVIRCGNKIVMTDKIFKENGSTSPKKLPKMLEEAFQAELILIPWDTGEKFGHAYGMVRYVGHDHISSDKFATNVYPDGSMPSAFSLS